MFYRLINFNYLKENVDFIDQEKEFIDQVIATNTDHQDEKVYYKIYLIISV